MGGRTLGSESQEVAVSEFSIIHDASLRLRRSLFDALQATDGTGFGLDGDIERITLRSPAAAVEHPAVASLYLYRFGINPSRRLQANPPERGDSRHFRTPAVSLRLHLLFAPLLDDESANLLLLGRVLQQVHDEPVITMLNGQPVDDSHPAADLMLRCTPEELEPLILTGLWSALGAPLRLAAFFKLETIAVANGLPPR